MRFIPFVVRAFHSAPALHSILRADLVKEPREPFAIPLARVVTARVGIAVPLLEMRKFLRDEREISLPRS